MSKKPTIHNPTHFEPSDYEVTDYLDNKRPQYFGQDRDAYELEVKWWKEEMARTFGPNWIKKIHHCIHCGNGNVRWITAVYHAPTKETVVFGSDCTERLGFPNRVAWKLAELQSREQAKHARIKIWNMRVRFLEAHPEVATAIETAKQPLHAGNAFVQDVLSKLDRYGSLSDKQVAAVLSSLARDVEHAARKAAEATEVKGPAPEGRTTVTGLVLSTKDVEGDWGTTTKMLLKLSNNARVWLTAPRSSDIFRGDTVTVTATFEVSKNDPSFGFGKRPHLVNVVSAGIKQETKETNNG